MCIYVSNINPIIALQIVFNFVAYNRNISILYPSTTNKMQSYAVVFITIIALHISGGSSAHHQELKTVYTTSGICRAFSASNRHRE